MDIPNIYEGNYVKFLAIPLLLLIATAFLAFVYPTVPSGIDLSGGTMIILRSETALDARQTEQLLQENFQLTDLSVVSTSSPLGGHGLTIRFAKNAEIAAAGSEIALARSTLSSAPQQALQHAQNAVDAIQAYIDPVALSQNPEEAVEQAASLLVDAKESFNNRIQQIVAQHFSLEGELAFQKKEVSPTLGSAFYQTALNVGIMAVIFVMIVVFAFFRKIVPSLAVIGSAALDVVGALGLMALFNIPLTLSSIPAILMLIGYSIDTDVMLTTKVLTKHEQSPGKRATEAMKTGLTMSATTLAALVVMIVLASLSQMTVVFEIAAVLFLGLLIDISSTWFMNAPVLLWYAERQERLP